MSLIPAGEARVIGHRGLAGLAPENTLAAFRAAAAHGLAMVEFDVRLSADGVPVVFHDDTLERTSTGHGAVAAHGWASLRSLDVGSWFGPAFAGETLPSLERVLTLCLELGLAVNMEIKPDAGREAETARIALASAAALWPPERPAPLVSSFAVASLEAAAAVVPLWRRGLLVEALPAGWQALAARLGVSAIHAGQAGLDAAAIAVLRDAGYAVRAYTVNDPIRAGQLLQWGVDAVFSDFPHSS